MSLRCSGQGITHYCNVYNNRKIENMLSEFSNYRFFLAKDSLREVIVTR